MQHEVGDERLLERGGEALDQLVRQAADEADRVGDEVAPPFDLEAARGRVERLEQAVVDRGVRAGERVQERRLADVRVAGERDRRRLRAAPRLAPRVALLGQPAQAVAQQRHAPAREPAVGLELALAGASRPDAAAEALEVLPEAAHARQVVLELRQLDLELALGADGVLGEDVEDQLRPVDHARLQRVLERPLLHGRELVVDDQRLRARALERLLQLLELALADVGARVGPLAVLDELGHRLDARGARELAQLGEVRGRRLWAALRARTRARARHPAQDRADGSSRLDYAAPQRGLDSPRCLFEPAVRQRSARAGRSPRRSGRRTAPAR